MYPAILRDNKGASQITWFVVHLEISCFHRLTTTHFLCTGILNLTKSPLPFCALLGCLTNFASAFVISTIAFKPKNPA